MTMAKHVELAELQKRIEALAKASDIGGQVRSVSVESNDDDEGGAFLRVTLDMKDLDKLEIEDVEPLVKSIEDAVASVDDRFASVRFGEAA
jgi:hypothetical protein